MMPQTQITEYIRRSGRPRGGPCIAPRLVLVGLASGIAAYPAHG